MASLVKCPVEIVHLIIYFMSKYSKDLASLALVNRHLNAIVTEELYRWNDTLECGLRTPDCRRALHWAAFVGRIGTVRKFLDRGANPNSYWFSSRPGPWVPDFAAPGPGRPIYCGESICEDRYGRSFVKQAPPASWNKWNKDIDPHDHSYPALSTFEASKSVRDTHYTVQQRSRRIHSLWTPLHLAVREGHLEVVQLLLSRGADPNLTSASVCGCQRPVYLSYTNESWRAWWFPLHLALCTSNDTMVTLLLNSGVPLSVATYLPDYNDPKADRKIGAAQEAIRFGRLYVLQYLLDSGMQKSVNLEKEYSEGYSETAVDHAYMHGKWEVFEYLL
ncbi:hypothetical protein PG994_003776 [Apiospora phragmitis]|uniref:Uncharacterized protein n=1 Tax=Apiospora phragmitis TaxID=2905665 RepID=A0ABR1W2W8_9PEZI